MDKLLVSVFKSTKRDEMYLYVERSKGFEGAPEGLQEAFGKPEHVMDMILSAERPLAREDVTEVMAHLREQGYHLQMPPPKDDYLIELPEEFLCFNDPV